MEAKLIRSRNAPHQWHLLVYVDDIPIEADIRADTQRRLEAKHDVEVADGAQGETYEFITLKKRTHADPAR